MKPYSHESASTLATSLHIDNTAGILLSQRNIKHPAEALAFFNPQLDQLHNPMLMKDMDKAVGRIIKAIQNEEKILVFGDYDVDGTTAVALFFQFMKGIYSADKIDFYIPHRYREGYGVSKAGIDYAHQHGFGLIVCLDCGIKSVELIDYAKSLAIDFIICDHHLPGPVLPKAAAILNPKQTDCPYPYKDLCGCGVGFKLTMALAHEKNIELSICYQYLDLVAVAIAADIVPMTGENRILAYFGLQKINSQPSLGIKTIMDLSATQKTMNISNVVFMIAPRVNAAGRMDDARKAVLLFIADDIEKALALGQELQSDNTDRKEKDTEITEQALQLITDSEKMQYKKSCVLYNENWHKGVVGIVASRVIERHYRPTIILTKSEGIATGSARSIKDFNLYEAIYECREHLITFGGHFAAAGLSLLPENVEAFADKFEEVVNQMVTEEMLIPELQADVQIEFNKLTPSLFSTQEKMQPFGPDNMKPVFWTKGVVDNGNSRLLKDKHIKFELKHEGSYMTGIGFNMAEKYALVKSGQPMEILYTLDENEYNGRSHLQLMISDCRVMA